MICSSHPHSHCLDPCLTRGRAYTCNHDRICTSNPIPVCARGRQIFTRLFPPSLTTPRTHFGLVGDRAALLDLASALPSAVVVRGGGRENDESRAPAHTAAPTAPPAPPTVSGGARTGTTFRRITARCAAKRLRRSSRQTCDTQRRP